MKTLKVLKRQKELLAKTMPKTMEVIKGTMVEMKKACGKPNCKCMRGEKHKALYVSQYVNGKPKMLFIPKAQEKRIRQCVENYKKIKRSINELSAINLEIIKREQ
jgi:hypothetical protein